MSSADRAAALRAQADALDELGRLETELLAAKAAYDDDPSDENKAAKTDAAHALREARSDTRSEGVQVGGDAYLTPGDELPQSVTVADHDQEV
ncbi:hypothetical protein [Streptosporangium sp. CA-115845]|uniref:hypothetical protein n=1 Tax=Streptosporangium sp. CA-115845 TaxID=3240071 RepID=UPI003D8F2B5F